MTPSPAPAAADLDALALRVDLLPLLQEASHLGRVTPLGESVRLDGGAQAGAWAAVARFAVPGRLRIVVSGGTVQGRMSVSVQGTDGGLSGTRVLETHGQSFTLDVADGAACQGLLFSSASADVAPQVTLTRLEVQALDYPRFPMAQVLQRQIPFVRERRSAIEQALIDLDVQDRFSPAQALTLAAVVKDFQPTVVLDLGTCTGGSAFSMALADEGVQIHTFDRESFWDTWVAPRASPPANAHAHVCDLTEFDFAPLVRDAERVMIFWDAHGFEIAGRVFSHLLPLIADKPHLVISHDISDNRFNASDEARSYGGRMMFRGYEHYDRNMGTTARANLGWMTTAVDQGIALADFAWRNRLELSSVDHTVKVEADPALREALKAELYGETLPTFDLTYFTMNQTYLRNFPSA